jgi:oligopeptide/dipeptide ABC transporter ATP-binding protein
MSRSPVLRVEGVHVEIPTRRGLVRAVRGVSFSIERGETFALVGESGCGKSMTARALMRLIHEPGRITRGAVELQGQDLLKLTEAEMQRVRGRGIAMVFQDAMTALHPLLTIEQQMVEALLSAMGRGEARARALALLRQVGIPDPEQKLKAYPHQLSAGQRQRVMIATAVAQGPQVLLADEPTSALDVTIQAEVLRLLSDLTARTGMAMLLITHDLGVVAEVADKVGVMYAGEIIEMAATPGLLGRPAHPYTIGLLRSMPRLDAEPLSPIEGAPPDPVNLPPGCPFAARCDWTIAACRSGEVPVVMVEAGRYSRCHRAAEVYAAGGARE